MVLFLFQRCKYAAKVHIILDTTMGKVVFFDGMLKNTTYNLHCVIAVLQYAICNKQFAIIFLGVYKYIYFNYIIYIYNIIIFQLIFIVISAYCILHIAALQHSLDQRLYFNNLTTFSI